MLHTLAMTSSVLAAAKMLSLPAQVLRGVLCRDPDREQVRSLLPCFPTCALLLCSSAGRPPVAWNTFLQQSVFPEHIIYA